MPRFERILTREHITADAIGAPGQRTFYLQAWQGTRTISILIEKVQLQSLAIAIEQFISDLTEKDPDLGEASADYSEETMHISPPVEPVFRAGEIGLGYDQDRDLMVIVTREIQSENEEPAEAGVVRFWCSRSQARAMARWGQEVASRGRPMCPQCGQPMEPEGHFCPKKNGHKH
jgi:uncharacterized repeat protein (TIGR03847 family)